MSASIDSVDANTLIQQHGVSISDLWQACVKSRGTIITSVVVCLGLALGYWLLLPPAYRASMLVADAQYQSMAHQQADSSSLNRLIGIGGQDREKFAQFQIMLKSNEVALRMWKNPTIKKTLFGNKYTDKHQTPSISDIKKAISGAISIEKIDDYTVKLTCITHDAKNSVYLLNLIYKTTDNLMREQARASAIAKVRYLTKALATNSNAAEQISLINLLSIQNMQLMFAEAKTPYAAAILDSPIVPTQPVNRLPKILLVAVFTGFVFGAAVALWKRNEKI